MIKNPDNLLIDSFLGSQFSSLPRISLKSQKLTMSETDEKVKELDSTIRWRKFYKDEAQRLKNSDHNISDEDRTHELKGIAEKAVDFRGTQLQDDWPTRLILSVTSVASAYSGLPDNLISDAAVMLLTHRAMRCLGLDGCQSAETTFRETCSKGGVQERTCAQKLWGHLENLAIQYRDEACLEGLRTWLEELFKELEVERASAIANEIIDGYENLRDINKMGRAYVTTQENNKRVLKHLKLKAKKCHTIDLIPAVVRETQ